jgi:Xaa-Pro aminopeptidase
LDGYDGPALWAPDTELQANMVLSFHPGTVMENNRGFLISDNFLVSAGGGVRLSPHVADRYFMRLER